MFELITDVPTSLVDFYTTKVVSEQQYDEEGLPLTVSETYTYIDIDETEATGTKLVPVFVDVTYVVKLTKPQSVSWAKVKSVSTLHKGKRDDVVEKFTALAIETDKWNFHDSYIAWLNVCKEVASLDKASITKKWPATAPFRLR